MSTLMLSQYSAILHIYTMIEYICVHTDTQTNLHNMNKQMQHNTYTAIAINTSEQSNTNLYYLTTDYNIRNINVSSNTSNT